MGARIGMGGKCNPKKKRSLLLLFLVRQNTYMITEFLLKMTTLGTRKIPTRKKKNIYNTTNICHPIPPYPPPKKQKKN